jgi:hypothetical protein
VRATAERLGVTGLAWSRSGVAKAVCAEVELFGEGHARWVAERI